MGSVFSRQKNAVTELEHIVLKLNKLHSRSTRLQENRYNLLWWLTVLFLFTASTYSGVICVNDVQPRIPLVIIIWVVGLSLFFVLRFIMVRMFDFIMRRDEKRMQELNTRRKKIIEEVKDNEKFKVAKEIIEKYGSPEDLVEIGVSNSNDKTKKVNSSPSMLNQPNNLNSSTDSTSDHEPLQNQHKTPINQALNADQDVALMKQKRIAPFNQAFATPAFRRQPIRPFIQPTRTPIDKIIDLIVGDGPGNRFALICSGCHVHNGMAVAEEFYDMSYICFNCGLYNPARNANPHFNNPKLNASNRLFLTGSPVSSPTIRTATNSESSENEDEEENDNTLKNNEKPKIAENKPEEEEEEETASDN